MQTELRCRSESIARYVIDSLAAAVCCDTDDPVIPLAFIGDLDYSNDIQQLGVVNASTDCSNLSRVLTARVDVRRRALTRVDAR